MNSNINEVTESIGKKVVVITKNLDEIRELLKELNNGMGNLVIPLQDKDDIVKETTIPSSVEQPVVVPELDFTQLSSNNKITPVNSKILLNTAREKFKNFKPERDSFDKNDLHLLANIAAKRHDDVQDYLTPEQKDKIKGFAEARLRFLEKNPKVNNREISFLKDALKGRYEEKDHRNDVTTFSPVSTDRSITDRSTVSPLVTPSSSASNSPLPSARSTSSSPETTSREEVIEAWKGGIKTRKRKHRTTKRSRTNKKSHSHKKRH